MSDPPRSRRPPRLSERSIASRSARGTRSVAVGPGRPASEPLYQTSVYDFDTIAASEPALAGEGFVYARNGRPNGESLERSLAQLEGAEAALATSSGMSAILAALLSATSSGDRVLCQRDLYGGTRALLDHDAPRLGLTVEYVDAYEPSKVADGLARGARLVLVESLSNPLLRETDIAALAWHTHAAGALLCVDNTFATPVFRRPLELGADLVVHSATKFLGGHDDVCAGVLLGGEAFVTRARALAVRMGFGVAPLDAWLAQRGLRTLSVRMQRAQATARALSPRLAAHPAVRAVFHPGWGGLISFDLGARAAAEQLVAACPNIPLRPSLGGTDSSFSHAATSSHRALSPSERQALGIGDGLLRLSVGLEEPDDLWEELAAALPRGG